MINQFLEPFFQILVIACCATAWVLLCQAGELLDFVPAMVQKVTMNPKINKVLYQCEKCAAGQIAFWWQLYHTYTHIRIENFIWFVMVSITVTTVVGSFVFGMKNRNGR